MQRVYSCNWLSYGLFPDQTAIKTCTSRENFLDLNSRTSICGWTDKIYIMQATREVLVMAGVGEFWWVGKKWFWLVE